MISYICTGRGLRWTLHTTFHMKGKCVHHNNFSPFANNASAEFPTVSLPSSSCSILSPLHPWTALHFSRRFRGRQRDLCVYTPAPPTRGWGTPKTWLERAEPQFFCGVSTLNTSLADPVKGVREPTGRSWSSTSHEGPRGRAHLEVFSFKTQKQTPLTTMKLKAPKSAMWWKHSDSPLLLLLHSSEMLCSSLDYSDLIRFSLHSGPPSKEAPASSELLCAYLLSISCVQFWPLLPFLDISSPSHAMWVGAERIWWILWILNNS